MTIQRSVFESSPGYTDEQLFSCNFSVVAVHDNYTIVEYDDASQSLSGIESAFTSSNASQLNPTAVATLPTMPARAPRDYVVVEVDDDGNVHASTESERIASGATFDGDNITRTLPAVSGLRDGHRVRFSDPYGELGGLLPTLSLVIATADSATVRYGDSSGSTFTTAREGAVVDVELVKGAQGDGSDSVWIVGGDGAGLLGL